MHATPEDHLPTISRNYKDRLFRKLFEDKSDLLDLYNAVRGTHYTDADAIQITTLGDAIYIGKKNDIGFICEMVLNLYEHQSTFSLNYPLRGLFYFSHTYEQWIVEHQINLFQRKQIGLPFPQYVVFYNGKEDIPDRSEYFLSDAFEQTDSQLIPSLECKVTVFNINKGHNEVLLGQCHKLWEYAEFIGTINTFLAQGMPPEQAVDMAVDYCIKHGILAEFLRKHRAEVKNMSILEYTLEDALANQLREGREEGLEEGLESGMRLGREEGLETGARMGLLKLLEFRGFKSDSLRSRIMQQSDFDTLQHWFDQALAAASASEFECLIGCIIPGRS